MGHPAVASNNYDFGIQDKSFPGKNIEDEHDITALQFHALKSVITSQFEAIFNGTESKAHQKGLLLVEKLSYQFMLNALFVDLGWNPSIGEVVDPNNFMRHYNLRTEFKLLLLTIFRRLENDGLLEQITSKPYPTWRVLAQPPSKTDISRSIKDYQTDLVRHPECYQEGIFVNYIGPYLYSVLSGKENGLNVLFPAEDSPGFPYGAKRFYERSMTMKYYKLIPTIEGITNQVQFLLNNGLNSISRPIRILEIGGGTGGTTIPLMRSLTKLQLPIEYTFTDISNFFVGKTKSLISEEFPGMIIDYKMVDIERPLEEQGIEIKSYDIVIAADVLHATEYLDDTLIHARQALKDGGLLVLGEVFQSSMMLEISFGFAGGWWRWGDEFRVHESPLLQPSEWDSLLRQTGYAESFSVGHPCYGVVFARANITNVQI